MSPTTERRLLLGLMTGWTVLTVAFFAWSVSRGVLSTDPAKYALNIPVPHPPLGRWISLASQALFGSTILAVRLPTLLADLGAAWLLFALVLKRGKASSVLLLAPVLLHAATVSWTGQGFQTSFLALGLALIIHGFITRERISLAFLAVGYLLAVWSQIQGVLLLPLVGWALWRAWQEDADAPHRWRVGGTAALLLTHTALVALWLGTNPYALADALDLAKRSEAAGLARLVWVWRGECTRLILSAAALALGAWWTKRRPNTETLAYLTTVSLFAVYLYKNPAPYYVSYALPLAIWGVLKLQDAKRGTILTVTALLAALAAFDLRLLWKPVTESAPQRTAADIATLRAFAGGTSTPMALGDYGYDWNYLLGTTFVRFPRDPQVQASARTAFVLLPETLSEEERAFVQTFNTSTTVRGVTVYQREKR